MASVLSIVASPRAESNSLAVAHAFLDAYRQGHPDDTVETLDLFTADLPAFAAPLAKAKYAVLGGGQPTDDAERAWAAVIEIVNHFKAAEKYVFAVPMWNFGIPYRLKHYIDLLVQPHLTFRYSPDAGYSGLVTGKPAFVAYARGGAYGEGSGLEAMDHQKPYLEQILGFIGFTDIRSVLVEPMLMGGPAAAADALAASKRKAAELAAGF